MKHYCASCYHSDVRLYRSYGSFLRDSEIFCNLHLPATDDTRGWWVPLVEDADGGVWGYTSAPPEDMARWLALPEYDAWGLTWVAGRWVRPRDVQAGRAPTGKRTDP